MASFTRLRRSSLPLAAQLALSLTACGDGLTRDLSPDVGTGSPRPAGPAAAGSADAGGNTLGDSADDGSLPIVMVDAGAAGMVPAPPPFAIKVPAYAQPEGDPDLGYDYL